MSNGTTKKFEFEGFESWEDLQATLSLEEVNAALKTSAMQKHFHSLYNAKKTLILRKVKELGLEKELLEK